MENNGANHFFHQVIAKGVYLISCPEWELEKASVNSWLIVGSEMAALIDAGLPAKGLRSYAENLAGREVRLLLSHGHYDHVGAIDEFDDFWMHPDDLPLLSGADEMPVTKYHGTCHPLFPGEYMELGEKGLQVQGVKGHTAGSLVFFEAKSGILFSGDSVCRRVFYHYPERYPLTEFFGDLVKLDELNFKAVASAHDRFLLPADQNHYMIEAICENAEKSRETWAENNTKYCVIHAGNGPLDKKYISCSYPESERTLFLEAIKIWQQRGAHRNE